MRRPANHAASVRPAIRQARLLLFWLAILPFLALSLMAPGTMLDRADDDRVTVVLCLPEGPVEVAISADGTPVPVGKSGHGTADRDICDWAIHGQPMLGTLAQAAPDFVPVALRLRLALPPDDHAGKLAVLAPSARGPPSLITVALS